MTRASSPAQEAAWLAGEAAPFEAVRDGIWTVGIPMPGGRVGQLPCTLTSLLADDSGGLHVIDPGSDSVENLTTLTAAVVATGHRLSAVRSITVTHLHDDHLGLAHRLRSETGAVLLLHRDEQSALDRLAASVPDPAAEGQRLEQWGVPSERRSEILALVGASTVSSRVSADALIDDGELLGIPGRRVRVVHTPGHTPGHACFVDEDAGLVFAGDHASPVLHPGFGLGGDDGRNPVVEGQRSLRRIAEVAAALGIDEAVPGHGYRFAGFAQRCDEHARHHARRTEEVAQALAAVPDASVFEIASRLSWSAGWAGLAGFTLRSALAQTAMHADAVRSSF